MADFARPIRDLAKREVQVDPHPGQGIALDHLSLIPANALGSGTTASNVFLAGDRSWRTVAGGGGGDGGVGIVASNTTWTAGTITISGFGAATVNTAASLVRISVPVQTAETAISGIQATNTTFTSGTVTITGSNMITVKSSALGQGVVIDATQSVQTQNMVAISASNTLYSSGTVTFTGSNLATVKTNAAQGVVIDVADPTPSLSYFDNGGAMSAGIGANAMELPALTFGSLLVVPLTPFNEMFPGKMTVSTAMVQMTHNHSQTSVSSSHSSTVGIGIYTRVNSTQLSLLNSVRTTWAQAAATNQTASYHGQRWITIHSSLWSASPTFSQAQYWMGFHVNSSNLSTSGSFVGQRIQGTAQRSGSMMSSVATNTTMAHYPFMGLLSVSTAGLPATIANSDVNKAAGLANFIPNIVFNNIASSL